MRPLLVIQYWDYQYHQIKPFIDLIDPALILVRLTTEESLAGINRSGYRLVNREEGSISEEEFSEMQISDLGLDLSYVIYTGVPYSGLDRLAQATEKGFCACIGHSLICSRYDSKLVLPTTRRCIGLVPECWTTFSAFKKESECRSGSRFIVVPTTPLAISSIYSEPRVEVEEKIGVVFGAKSAFLSYYEKLDCILGAWPEIEGVKVKFHPITNMETEGIKEIISDSRFEVLPTDSDKYDFTDSCRFIIGGCSSLLIESVLRNKFYNRGQFISKFKERRGIDLNMFEDGIDKLWTGVCPHEHMVNPELSILEQLKDCKVLLESLYFNDSVNLVVSDLGYRTRTAEEFFSS